MTVVTSRRDVDLTICSCQYPRIKLGSALILIVILFLTLPGACWKREYLYYHPHQNVARSKVWKHINVGISSIACFRVVVENETWYLVFFVLISELNLLDRSLGSMIIWGKILVVSGLFYAWFVESQSIAFLAGLTRINPTALLIANALISDFRYDYCGSIPPATALGINIRVFGVEAVLFWNWNWIFETCTLFWTGKVRMVRFGWTLPWRAHRQGEHWFMCWFMPVHNSNVWCVWPHRIYEDGKSRTIDMIGGPNLRYARVDRTHDVHTGRGNIGLCLCTNLIYDAT